LNLSSSSRQPINDVQLKKSTAKFYEDSFLNSILRNILHPGGLKLTEQLAVLADINEKSTVLDVASGKGISAIFLAKRFGCEVVGVDLSKDMIKKAADLAKTELISNRAVFEVGDAEKLPFKTETFNAIISECALCLFPTKKRALSEMYRVLKDGGKIALSDVTLNQTRKELRNKLLFFSCIAGAESLGALKSIFEDVGFVEVTAIDTSQVIVDLYKSLKRQTFLLKPLLKIVGNSCGCFDLKNIEEFARTAEQLILEGKLGYGVLTGRKPVH
jgi:SAM-dependent methyltransferase